MRAARLQDALERLTTAIRDVESELAAMKAEHDPLASHIFVSRRHYRNIPDTKSGKRREMMARLSFNTAWKVRLGGSHISVGGGCVSLRLTVSMTRLIWESQFAWGKCGCPSRNKRGRGRSR
jgi:hypothetical protein